MREQTVFTPTRVLQDTAPVDRRREPRRSPRGGMGIVCQREGSITDIAIDLLDVSASGARLLVKEALPVGQAVEVCLYPANSPEGFCHAGHVIWSSGLSGGYYCIGVEFD